MKSTRPRVDLRIVVDESDGEAKPTATSVADHTDDAWWLAGYRLPPPGHLGAHSVPVVLNSSDKASSAGSQPTDDLFRTPTQAADSGLRRLLAPIQDEDDACSQAARATLHDVTIPSLRRDQRRGAVLPSIASLISISPPTAKRSATSDAPTDGLDAIRAVKHFKLL
ncbi:hypothetical protein LEN26_006394 [Aphanomyces euteiches]|nr:hypothetical protein AeMF1_016473 [Aphanomyces euteiches]KAH9135580.1 hypothetical protein LEN26_006394 [Aphanomyces euteiches]KAH9193853.1 hypothetical protein AeNC1_004167 [Aphanomyces euteiches]